MATKNFQVLSPDAGQMIPPGTVVVLWAGMNNGDDGAPFPCSQYPDKSVQVYGNFGTGGTLSVQGALHPSSNNYVWGNLEDGSGTTLAFNAAKGNNAVDTVQPNVMAIRPIVGAGDANTNLNCLLVMTTVARRS